MFLSNDLWYVGVSYFPVDLPDGEEALQLFTDTSMVGSLRESLIFLA